MGDVNHLLKEQQSRAQAKHKVSGVHGCMTQMTGESIREGTLLDLAFKQEPVGCICGCSNNESVIQHPETREQGKIRITILNTKRTDSGLFRDLLWRTLWGYTPPEKGVQENSLSRTTFKLNNGLLTHAGSQGRVTGGIHQCTKSPLKKGSIQEMEAASSHLGGIQGQSLSLQGWVYRWFWHEIWKTRRTSSRRKSRKNMSPVSNKVKIQVAKNFDHLHY